MKTSRLKFVFVAVCVLLIVSAAVFAGCSSSQTATSSSTSDKAASTNESTARTIADAYGREVEVPASVKTCATVGSATRFVVYAGATDKLVGVTEIDQSKAARRPYTIPYAELFADLPSTSNGNHLMETSVDGEALLKLNPDVIISSRSEKECSDLQEQIGIPVVGIKYQNQMFSDDVFDSLRIVGDVLGTSAHAGEVAAKMQEWQEDLYNRTENIPDADRPLCYAGAINYKGAKSFGGTYAKYAPFEAVNIDNAANSAAESGSVEVTLEQLGEWNPEFLFLNESNMELLKKDYNDNKGFFESLKAFKEQNVYSQPSCIMNGVNVELAVCDAYFNGATVYPDAFKDIDLNEKYGEILTVLLGVNCLEELKADGIFFGKLNL